MSVCILHADGELMLHRHMHASPEAFLKAIAPAREELVVAVECLVTWYWLADLCAQAGMPCIVGPVLDRKAIHGGKAKHDTIDAHTIAARLRGGMLPQASVDPAQMRATRDLLRRRLHLMRKRAERMTHVQQTNRQDHRPEIGQTIADQANRDGVAERVAEPAGHKRIAVDLALMTYDDPLLSDLEWSIVKRATPHEAHPFFRLPSVPGVGNILALGRLDESHDRRRFPRVQDVASSGRLVTCTREAAGTRDGNSGPTIGHASLTWAFSDAAVVCLRNTPAGQKSLARLEKTHGPGQALTILAHQLARAVDDLLRRATVCDRDTCLCSEGEPSG